MIFISKGIPYRVSDDIIERSPLLKTIATTKLDVEIDEESGAVIVGDESEMFDMMSTYVEYLSGKIFFLDTEEEKELFLGLYNYMGHIVPDYFADYPPDVVAIKIHDNWIRENLLPLELGKQDPFTGLIEIPRRRYVDVRGLTLPAGTYIAGGYAMYLAGWTDVYKDIDLFFTRKEALVELLERNISTLVHGHTHERTVYEKHENPFVPYQGRQHPSFEIFKNSITIMEREYQFDAAMDNPMRWSPQIQGILRLYSCPSEIVHGFDVDCVGILYDPSSDKLYATLRAFSAFQNKRNVFDPERASPSYVFRLSKYAQRGYDIFLPGFNMENVNQEEIQDLKKFLLKTTGERWAQNDGLPLGRERWPETPGSIPLPDVYRRFFNRLSTHRVLRPILMAPMYYKSLIKLNISNPWRALAGYNKNQLKKYFGENYHDADRLILLKVLGINPLFSQTCISDYEDPEQFQGLRGEEFLNMGDNLQIVLVGGTLYVPPDLPWRVQDPGTQVTSTFNPEPIEDIQKWLESSRYYSPHIEEELEILSIE